MNCLVIAGFLGSGKTTLILQLARLLTSQGKKIAILENEIGTAPIDGAVLQSEGLWVKELFAGCVCCSMQRDFVHAVQDIHDQITPDYLLIEPTGIATPGLVQQHLKESLHKDVSITCVYLITKQELTKTNRLRPFIEASIRDSQHVVVNTFGQRFDEKNGLNQNSPTNPLIGDHCKAYPLDVANSGSVETWFHQITQPLERPNKVNEPRIFLRESDSTKSLVTLNRNPSHLLPALASHNIQLLPENQPTYLELVELIKTIILNIGREVFIQNTIDPRSNQLSEQSQGHLKAIIQPQGSRLSLTSRDPHTVHVNSPNLGPMTERVQRIDIQFIVLGVESSYLQGLLDHCLDNHADLLNYEQTNYQARILRSHH